MRNPVKILLGILISVVMSVSAVAQNNRPIDIIRNTIDKSLTIMNDPQYESDAKQDQLQQKVWEVIRDVFDHNEKWRIYDITIEGVSMIKNYRSQFKEILTKESPAQLIERLKEKLKP